MNLTFLLDKALKTVRVNSSEILTAMSVTGVVTTTYLTVKATFEASGVIRDNEKIEGISDSPKQRLKTRAEWTWPLYLPALASGAATVVCIVVNYKGNKRRTAAAVTAYSLTEKAFSEYRDKVVEQMGKGKEQAIRDNIAQDKVTSNPSGNKEVIVVGSGHVLCCELHTQRYFRSDMESLRKAQNDINAKIIHQMYVTLEDFYDLIGLAHTSTSNLFGWDSNRLMALQFSTVLANDHEPCLAFDYNYVKPLK